MIIRHRGRQSVWVLVGYVVMELRDGQVIRRCELPDVPTARVVLERVSPPRPLAENGPPDPDDEAL